MKNKRKKLTACALVAVLGFSGIVSPVHAEDAQHAEQTDVGGLPEWDKTAVSAKAEGTAETKQDTEVQNNEPRQTEEPENTNASAEQPKQPKENALQTYANDTGDFVVTGGTYGVDYTYDSSNNKLYIWTDTVLTITTNGKATAGMIWCENEGIYNLVFDNLVIDHSWNDTMILCYGVLNLTLYGDNSIKGSGYGFSAGNLFITDKSTGILDLRNNVVGIELGASWSYILDKYDGNLEVNGGSLLYNDSDIKGTISTSGTGTINGKVYVDGKPQEPVVVAPQPTFTTTQTASSITVKLQNYEADYGEVQYQWDNGEWGSSATLNNLGANQFHSVSVRYMGQGKYTQSETATTNVQTKQADYTITIPATSDNPLEAGKTGSSSIISVNTGKSFDLGYNGQVDVKIKNDSNSVSADAKLKLQHTSAEKEITSVLLVNNTPLGNINKSVATFKNKNDSPVTVSFAEPTETNILAGTYNGIITFEVLYSEQ